MIPDHGAGNFRVALILEHEPEHRSPDLSALRRADHLEAMQRAVAALGHPYPWAAISVAHGLDHLMAKQLALAWPPLVIGVQALYLAGSERTRPVYDRSDRPRLDAPSGFSLAMIEATPINPKVRELLGREACSSNANVFRHGRYGEIDIERQCELWLLALCAWFDWMAVL